MDSSSFMSDGHLIVGQDAPRRGVDITDLSPNQVCSTAAVDAYQVPARNPFDQSLGLVAHAARDSGRVIQQMDDDIEPPKRPVSEKEQQRREKLSASSNAYWAARRKAAPPPPPPGVSPNQAANKRYWDGLKARAAAAGMTTRAFRKHRAEVGLYAVLAKLTPEERQASANNSSQRAKIRRAAEARARGMTVEAYYAFLREQRGQK